MQIVSETTLTGKVRRRSQLFSNKLILQIEEKMETFKTSVLSPLEVNKELISTHYVWRDAMLDDTVDISTSSLFTDGMKVGTTKGAGYAFIENVVNNKLLTEENKLKLEKIINDNWDAVLEKAVRRAMQRRAVIIANELVESKS